VAKKEKGPGLRDFKGEGIKGHRGKTKARPGK